MYGVARPAAAHGRPNCHSPGMFARRDLHTRHLGASLNFGSCKSSPFNQSRLVTPRHGRLTCQAARQVSEHLKVSVSRDIFNAQVSMHTPLNLQKPFQRPREMDGVQKALANLPGQAFYGAALLLITAAGALGFAAGSKAPGACSMYDLVMLHGGAIYHSILSFAFYTSWPALETCQ